MSRTGIAAARMSWLRSEADILVRCVRPGPEGLEAPLPTCPGWTVRDVLAHLAQVYRHKIECIRLRAEPAPWPPQWPDVEPVAWLRDSLSDLLVELDRHSPEDPAYTWYGPDQTVGFWIRRMALETAVHRVDVQAAYGEVTAVPDDLAVDGVDEVLGVMLAGDWSEAPFADSVAGVGGTVAVRTGDRAWLVGVHAEAVEVLGPQPAGAGPSRVDATVSAEPSELMLWLWGRRPDSAVALGGDLACVALMRDRLRAATQ